jgi:hypothetical protein
MSIEHQVLDTLKQGSSAVSFMVRLKMNDSGRFLLAGKVSDDHFELLLNGTSIRGTKVIPALREHLVNGVAKGKACEMHGANFSQFSSRLATLLDENERISKLVPFYSDVILSSVTLSENRA